MAEEKTLPFNDDVTPQVAALNDEPSVLKNAPVDDAELRPAQHQEFFLPIHEFVRFSEEELAVIDHPAFQRLGKIYQLGQSHYVYRGATHKRLEHVLGTVHVAQMMIDSVENNYRTAQQKRQLSGKCLFCAPLSPAEIRFIRLGALLHDIGHLPAGHTLEDELSLLNPHDEDERLDLVFDQPTWDGRSVVKFGTMINDTYRRFVPQAWELTPREVLRLVISKSVEPSEIAANSKYFRVQVCRDIVGNTICADLLDYLHRDWYHVGKPKFFEKRLFQYMQIRQESSSTGPEFVISYGHRDRPKRDAISAILELLESRYNLAEAVLFHPTKCSAASMLERGIFEVINSFPTKAKKDQWLKALPSELLAYSDEQALQYFRELARSNKSVAAQRLFEQLSGRQLFKSVANVSFDQLHMRVRRRVAETYLGMDLHTKESTPETRSVAAEKRILATTLLEKDFRLNPGTVTFYCPPFKMNTKIAEVRIEKGGAIMTLNEWDLDEKLAGGHCEAQVSRFAGLWRIEAFLTESEKEKMVSGDGLKWRAFQNATKLLLFGLARDDSASDDEAYRAMLNELASIKGWHFENVAPDLAMAAQHGDISYPVGPRTLQSLVEKP